MKPMNIRDVMPLDEAVATIFSSDRKKSVSLSVLADCLRIDRKSLPSGFFAFDVREDESITMPSEEILRIADENRDALDKYLSGVSAGSLAAALEELKEQGWSDDLSSAFFNVLGLEIESYIQTAADRVLVNHETTVVCRRSLADIKRELGIVDPKEEPVIVLWYDPNKETKALADELEKAL